MDTSFMKLHGIEHFSLDSYFPDHTSFESSNLDDLSNHSDNIFTWEWQNEANENTDVLSSNVADGSFSDLSSSPSKDINKMLHEWHQLINVDTSPDDIAINFPNLEDKNGIYEHPFINENNFDITTYVNETEPIAHVKSIGPGGKKIDMQAQKYVVDDAEDDNVDVETISEHPSPVLEACDVNSLLEQFEAETQYNISNALHDCKHTSYCKSMHIKQENYLNHYTKSFVHIKEEPEDSADEISYKLSHIKKEPEEDEKTLVDSVKSVSRDRNKLIIDALPEELINRIKQCSKRKPISVIPAKPTRKRGRHSNAPDNAKKTIKEAIPFSEQPPCKSKKLNCIETEALRMEDEMLLRSRKSISIDHDYCIVTTPYPKQPMKDSGFESAEEEEKYLMKNQPIYRDSNGKTMVSILKPNTIRNNNNNAVGNALQQKKKLNLEEYKKRRDLNFKSSASNSPVSSGRTSPTVVEDEQMKRIKHQELLMKMASEILKPKKEEKKIVSLPEFLPKIEKPDQEITVKEIKPPSNLEMKILLSVGTNTVESWFQLKEINPILENINVKINQNSLIAAVIENIPKVKKETVENSTAIVEHGEDKTIVYLDKNRPAITTCNVCVQTDNCDMMEIRRCGRRRNSSSSDSTSSFGSTTYSSSRSRSPSPISHKVKHKKHFYMSREKMREVEERRVIYVGGISDSITRDELKKRFQIFGPISNVSVHFRNYGDNYGFVTFVHKLDAYEAVEHGNDNPALPRYDLSFGGRRMFCKTNYADLDDVRDDCNYFSPKRKEDSFDALLRDAQAKLRKRKL